ncbi:MULTISPECIES: tyrosine-type recombinase/integrase, partial [Cyanophyceae]|uniref:tyrosine-type recombinase/integrase n=1 Tax=Cyanophyceae TaxID=3028117 RepID=UPI001685EC49
ACKKIGLEGVSTHSFRRTALTQMSDACIPLRVIAQISGHQDLSQLHAYLEVSDTQVRGAIASLSRLSYIGKVLYDDVEPDRTPVRSPVEKCMYDDLKENPLSTPIDGSGLIEQDS